MGEFIETIEDTSVIDVPVPLEMTGERLDRLLACLLPDLTRTFIQKVILSGGVHTSENKPIKASYRVCGGETLFVTLPEPIDTEAVPEDIPLDILYEDESIIVINKSKNMVVHPAPGHYTGTLVNALLYHCKGNLSGINGVIRPGIVHRIDKDTTGVLVACKTDNAHKVLAERLKTHDITREYTALCYRSFDQTEGIVDAPIGRHLSDRKKMAINLKNGRNAITQYHVIENYGKRYTMLCCKLMTGRTHQIRVHMASIGHPLIGDPLYASGFHASTLIEKLCVGQCLHAGLLGFVHPVSNVYMEFRAPIPAYMESIISCMRQECL